MLEICSIPLRKRKSMCIENVGYLESHVIEKLQKEQCCRFPSYPFGNAQQLKMPDSRDGARISWLAVFAFLTDSRHGRHRATACERRLTQWWHCYQRALSSRQWRTAKC